MEKVTQRNLEKFPVGRYLIERNLYYLVKSNGFRGFYFRAMVDGKVREKSLGSIKKVTLAFAKNEAQRLRGVIGEGGNPFEKKPKEERQAVPTFKDCAKEAIDIQEKMSQWRNVKSRASWENTLSAYAYPAFGNKPVNEITLDNVYEALKKIWYAKNPTALKIRGRIERVFDYAIFKGYITTNPARWRGGLETLLTSPKKLKSRKHHEAPFVWELQSVVKQIAGSKKISYKAVLFGALTCARVSEFLRLRWEEIDFNRAVWLCPPEKTKTGVLYRYPLSRQAIDLLKSIPQVNEHVFVSYKRQPLSIDTPRKLLREKTNRAVTMHGVRSTFRDWCAENGIDRVLAEKSLMHVVGSEVEQAYQRSDLLEQRRPLMQRWADFLMDFETDTSLGTDCPQEEKDTP